MTDEPSPTKVFNLVEKDSPTTFVINRRYISSRDGQVGAVRCVRGGSSDDKDEPPVFLPSGSSMALEFRLFDWLLVEPE